MSAENEKKEAKTVLPDVRDPEIKESQNVVDGDSPSAEVDGGQTISVAPTVESVSNTEAMVLAQKKAIENGGAENNFKFPQLFIKKEELIDIEIDIIFDSENGEVYSITQAGIINAEGLDALSAVKYTFKFKPVNYDDMQKYRRQSSFYDSNAGDLIINRLLLRNLFLINHLRSTNLTDAEGNPIKVEVDLETNNLTLESINQLYDTIPALLDVVMTLFERRLMMLFQVGG